MCRILCVALLAAGCGPSVKVVHGPNARPALAIEGKTAVACYEEAARRCPAGYVILDRAAISGGTTTVSGHTVVVADAHTLLIECRAAAVAAR